MLHQRHAHGPLPWLEGRDSQAAMMALLEVGAFGTLDEVVAWLQAEKGVRLFRAEDFWKEAYARWLRAVTTTTCGSIPPTPRE